MEDLTLVWDGTRGNTGFRTRWYWPSSLLTRVFSQLLVGSTVPPGSGTRTEAHANEVQFHWGGDLLRGLSRTGIFLENSFGGPVTTWEMRKREPKRKKPPTVVFLPPFWRGARSRTRLVVFLEIKREGVFIPGTSDKRHFSVEQTSHLFRRLNYPLNFFDLPFPERDFILDTNRGRKSLFDLTVRVREKLMIPSSPWPSSVSPLTVTPILHGTSCFPQSFLLLTVVSMSQSLTTHREGNKRRFCWFI